MGRSTVPNEVANKVVLRGTEVVLGTAVTPTARWLGELAITKDQSVVDRQEATGGYHRKVNPRLGTATFAGTYAEDLAFENFPDHQRYWIASGGTGVSDAETTPGYVYTKSPAFATDDIDSATVQYGVPGLMFLSTGVMHNEGTVTIDVDDADGVWKGSFNEFVRSKEILPTVLEGTATAATANSVTMTAAGYVASALVGRYININPNHAGQLYQITANTTDTITWAETADPVPTIGTTYRVETNPTSGISIPDYEFIPTYGTQVYIDPIGGTIGTTEVQDRIISTNVTITTNRTPKRFLNNGANEVSSKTGRGAQLVTGQIRVEFDRFDEYNRWENLEAFQLRIYQEGSVIDATAGTVKYAQIDVPRAYFTTPTEDARENNMTMTLAWEAYLPDTDPIITFETKNTLAVLP